MVGIEISNASCIPKNFDKIKLKKKHLRTLNENGNDFLVLSYFKSTRYDDMFSCAFWTYFVSTVAVNFGWKGFSYN